ncbi:MAG: N-formylglutamate amidohydrolase [Rhodospirillales bacterium]
MTHPYVPPFGPDPDAETLARTPWALHRPAAQTAPVVVASPHSGRLYPQGFTAESRLEKSALRRSEDAYVDCLFADAPALGAPLLRALFPRVMVDANRGALELDPAMFSDALPADADTKSARAAAGLGVIPRTAAGGEAVYSGKLRFADVRRRIEAFRAPYHAALQGLINETLMRFGACLLVDAHSMPSPRPGARAESESWAAPGAVNDSAPPDIVLGDARGAACAPDIVLAAEAELAALGLRAARNAPYAGGWTTRHYGRPEIGVHVLQIEISRGLYLDENSVTPTAGIETVRAAMARLTGALMQAADPLRMRPGAAAE